MPRAARALLLGGAALVVVAAIVTLALDRRSLAFSNGVAPNQAVATLGPGQRACQRRVPVIEGFARVVPATDTGGNPGPALDVEILDHGSGRAIRTGRAAGGYRTRINFPGAPATAYVGRVRHGGAIDVCLRNGGSRPVALVGTAVRRSGQSDLGLGGGARQHPAGGLPPGGPVPPAGGGSLDLLAPGRPDGGRGAAAVGARPAPGLDRRPRGGPGDGHRVVPLRP